jgi:uncharacterized protein YndB with AHSA1/START domain
MMETAADTPVRKSITVKAGADRAFRVFTEGVDTWWPRAHHIGNAPAKKFIMEGRVGGRCYTEQTDGAECDWGRVLEWEPPRRLVMAWQVSPTWQYEPDVAKSSEVEIQFTPLADGTTRVDLEHRYFERHGAGSAAMRGFMDAPNAWAGLLELFRGSAEQQD